MKAMQTTQRVSRHRQRGMSLLFTLLALVTLTIAAAALARSVYTGTLVIGNIGFKNDGVLAGAVATDNALTWLNGNISGSTLDANGGEGSGYYAALPGRLDPTGSRTSVTDRWSVIDWDGNCMGLSSSQVADCNSKPNISATTINGNQIKWVAFRMCTATGSSTAATNNCIFPAGAGGTAATEQGEVRAGGRIGPPPAAPYFQVYVRIEGPRNTVAYTETIVHF